jgi:uncharacterized RmlC-like cupin family protein
MKPEREPVCTVIRRDEGYLGKQGLSYHTGISAESANSRGLCMHRVTIPPSGRARPHLHEDHESALYVLSGEAGMWYGEGLHENQLEARSQSSPSQVRIQTETSPHSFLIATAASPPRSIQASDG